MCALREDRLRMKLLHTSIEFERLERVFAFFDGDREFTLCGVAVFAAKGVDLGFDGACRGRRTDLGLLKRHDVSAGRRSIAGCAGAELKFAIRPRLARGNERWLCRLGLGMQGHAD